MNKLADSIYQQRGIIKWGNGTGNREIHTKEEVHIGEMWIQRGVNYALKNINIKANGNSFNKTCTSTLSNHFVLDWDDSVDLFSH